ncbi:hypothetical protein SRB5_41670 [Streptomyces sp. RB5]|uniref:DUF948 domain-containing protein n=1 Tax=Streptomyces smaragdinus TaxID=2585196 RepID=A0A7K0CKK2_9ACTN|nr:hypothetical protein [Streptomyces smaragdinus]MQY14007.1 hypothetical protein [Streptomyces smaragdinus]
MLWPMIAIAAGVLGLTVLAVLAARVWIEVRRLARRVEEASEAVARAAQEVENAVTPLVKGSVTGL